MITTQPNITQTQFYREFLMGRGKFDPAEFGINISREEFGDQMSNDFNDTYHGMWTLDEMLLHPDEAKHFCNDIRRKYGYYDAPDDIILRVIMTNRKKS